MSAVHLAPVAELAHFDDPLQLDLESPLERWQLAYEIQGPPGAPVVLILGGISATAHVASSAADPRPGWWERFVGPGRAVDSTRLRVLGIDWVGGCGASSGPQDPGFLPGVPWPRWTPADQARALGRLLDVLEIDRLRAVVGYSYGGAVGLHIAHQTPDRVASLVLLGAAECAHPWALAWRSVQRRLLRDSVERGEPAEGVAIVRAMGMIGYRSPQEFGRRFPLDRSKLWEGRTTAVEEYLSDRGRSFAREFDPRSLHLLSWSLDLHHVEPHEIQVPTTLVGVDSDLLVPPAQLRSLASRLPALRRYEPLSLESGHDAFLKESPVLGRVVARALELGR